MIPLLTYSQKYGVNELAQVNSDNQADYSLNSLNVIHDTFKGKISRLDSNTYKFDDKTLFVINTRRELFRIFDLGILYPDIINVNRNNVNSQTDTCDLDSAVIVVDYNGNKTFNSIFGSDSLKISNLRELNSKQSTFKIKKFSFILFRNGFENPTEYYVELINDKANENMDLEVFLNGARLKNIEKGSILI